MIDDARTRQVVEIEILEGRPDVAALDSRGAVRAAVALVGKELLVENGSLALRGAWRHLVETLALTPAPELRECSSCGLTGMRAATRCGYCWAALEPLVAAPAPGA